MNYIPLFLVIFSRAMSPKIWISHVYFLSSHCLFGYLIRLRSKTNIFGFRSLNFFALHINHSSFSNIFLQCYRCPPFLIPLPQPCLHPAPTFHLFNFFCFLAYILLMQANHLSNLKATIRLTSWLANNRIFTIISA